MTRVTWRAWVPRVPAVIRRNRLATAALVLTSIAALVAPHLGWRL